MRNDIFYPEYVPYGIRDILTVISVSIHKRHGIKVFPVKFFLKREQGIHKIISKSEKDILALIKSVSLFDQHLHSFILFRPFFVHAYPLRASFPAESWKAGKHCYQ